MTDFETTGMGDTMTIIEETVRTTPMEPGDHDRFAHYVPKDKLTDAMVFGTALKALCGKEWVPTRDASKFPVCPDCKKKWEELEND